MDKRLLSALNEYLGQELGRRADGESVFAWMNSDELFWPATATGRKITKKVEIPLLAPVKSLCEKCGGNGTVVEEPYEDDAYDALCEECNGTGNVVRTSEWHESVEPEYVSTPQMRTRNVWVVTKWMDPEALIWGWIGRHGGEARPTTHPPHDQLVAMWERQFPGADFPSNGWRIPTDATLPSSPNGMRTPNWEDTRRFVSLVREQTRLGFDERLADMLASEDRKNDATQRQIEDEIRDCFPAMLNTPGKKLHVSFPWTKKDREREKVN